MLCGTGMNWILPFIRVRRTNSAIKMDRIGQRIYGLHSRILEVAHVA